MFYEGSVFKDVDGMEWIVVHAVTTRLGRRLLLVRRNIPVTNQWEIVKDNLDGTVTVLEKINY